MKNTQKTNRIWQAPGSRFSVKLTFNDTTPVLLLSGEIDVYTFPTLLKAMEGVIADGHNQLMVDFYDVTFLDSGGISALIKVHKHLEALSGRLDIERVHSHAYRVLEITGLLDILHIHPLNRNMAA